MEMAPKTVSRGPNPSADSFGILTRMEGVPNAVSFLSFSTTVTCQNNANATVMLAHTHRPLRRFAFSLSKLTGVL